MTVLRVSGDATASMLEALCSGRLPAPRRATLRRLHDRSGTVLDEALVLWMPAPASYTGEDCAELHLHGGHAVLEGVSAALADHGARPAEPGEFTRRAFLNGRLGLIEAEAVADLVEAETAAQRDQALRQLGGDLSRATEDLAVRLRTVLASEEARIDFPEEAGFAAPDEGPIRGLIDDLSAQLADNRRGERLRSGLAFAVVGPPNVGKSSLVNRLVGREAAIVAPTPGTTRDVLDVRVVFGGVPVTLLDTAGLRDSDDPVEAEGVRRARAQAASADCVLLVNEAGSELSDAVPPHWIRIASKTDLAPPASGWCGVSTVSGVGLDRLRALLDQRATELTRSAGPPPLTRSRHRMACDAACAHLRAALTVPSGELRAEELRLAMTALGRLTGHVGTEAILDDVFARFCIGK